MTTIYGWISIVVISIVMLSIAGIIWSMLRAVDEDDQYGC